MILLEQEYKPTRVIQIVSGSRSGSSLLKKLLAKSTDLTSLDGEEEPYFKLTGNGYGMTSNCDAFTTMQNASLFRRCIYTELATEYPCEWRFSLQYRGEKLARLLDALPSRVRSCNFTDWLRSMGVAGHYDGCCKEERLPFQDMVYEMAPYVIPTLRGCPGKTLLLKAPYNVYRPGVLESIFPEAQFSYIFLTRNPAATINGLIDGWKANYGFHKHLTPAGWWKFDLPPHWEAYQHKPVPDRCWLQWHSSYTLISERMHQGLVVKHEDVLASPQETVNNLCRQLDIQPPMISKLPEVMATETPKPFRWKERARIIEPLLSRSVGLIEALGYKDQSQWV